MKGPHHLKSTPLLPCTTAPPPPNAHGNDVERQPQKSRNGPIRPPCVVTLSGGIRKKRYTHPEHAHANKTAALVSRWHK